MKARKFLSVSAAMAVALAPVAANAATSLRAAPPMNASSHFADDESNHGGGSTAVILGVLLIVLIGIAAISGKDQQTLPKSP